MIVAIALLTALVIINAATLVYTIAHWDDHRRHTSSTIACIEDALSVDYDIQKYLDVEELRHESELKKIRAVKERNRKLANILREGRTSPYSYNPDQPAGRRPKGME